MRNVQSRRFVTWKGGKHKDVGTESNPEERKRLVKKNTKNQS
jgi:hypothetical protein